MSRERERELVSNLVEKKNNPIVSDFVELFTLRLDKHKNSLISSGCEVVRGRAQEVRDFIKFFE